MKKNVHNIKKFARRFLMLCGWLLFMNLNNAIAQILNTVPVKTNAVSCNSGLYGRNIGTTISYARGVHVNLFNIIKHDVTLFIDLSDRTNFKNRNDFRFTYGGQSSFLKIKSFKVIFRKTFTVSEINTTNLRGTYIGAEFELMPGIYKAKFFTALDIYYGDSFKGYVIDQNHFLSDITKGWIKPHRSILRFGINAGYNLKPNLCLYGFINVLAIRPKHDIYLLSYLQESAGITYLF